MTLWQFIKEYIYPTCMGIMFAIMTVAAVQIIGHAIYPLPAGIDMSDPIQVEKMMLQLPLGALLFVVFSWGAGSFVGSLVAVYLSSRRSMISGLVVGVFILGATLITLLAFFHPVWMFIAGLSVPMPAACLGVLLGRRAFQD